MGEYLGAIVMIWVMGGLVTFFLGVMLEWVYALPGSEVTFRLTLWPVFLVLLIVIGAYNTVKRLTL